MSIPKLTVGEGGDAILVLVAVAGIVEDGVWDESGGMRGEVNGRGYGRAGRRRSRAPADRIRRCSIQY